MKKWRRSSISALFHDRQYLDPAHGPSDYMGFVTTLVGVKTAPGVTPPIADVLASFTWNSNYNSHTGGIFRQTRPTPGGQPYDGTGGVFGIARVAVDALPLVVRQLLIDQGLGGVTSAPLADSSAPVTAAFFTGRQGTNGWYTGPLQVTLVAADVDGPGDVAAITCALDGGVPALYTGVFTIPDDGLHTLDLASVDLAGNREAARAPQVVKIDQTAPASQVAALPATGGAAGFTVQWSGADAGSGIQDYTVYVSDNHGAFSPWLTHSSATSATFVGQPGHSYGFYCLAQDVAGNQEPAKAAAEAITLVTGESAASSTALSFPTPAVVGTSVTLTATVTPGSATGTVQFYDGSNALGAPRTLANGSASLVSSGFAPGAHVITAVYSGDADRLGSSSPAATLTVNQAAATVTLGCSSATTLANAGITFTATVAGPAGLPEATGLVQFYDGGAALGDPAALASGSVTFATTALAGGTHGITASYAGDAIYAGATSSELTATIQDFVLQAGPPSAPVHPGGSAAIPLTITAQGGLAASTSFTCSGLPPGATASFDPATVTGSGSTLLTIVTTGAVAAAAPAPTGPWTRWGALLGCMLFLGLPLRGRRGTLLLCVWLALSLGALQGCNGSSGGKPGVVLTPAGTYAVTVTATSGAGGSAISHAATLTLTVN